MRPEGHRGLVHTAAASNLGQMLNKLCIEDGVTAGEHRPETGTGQKSSKSAGADVRVQLELTRVHGRADPGHPTATSATLAFDAIGGGKLASQILTAMEAAATAGATEYSRYGSATPQAGVHLRRSGPGRHRAVPSYGMAWGVGGWLLTPFLQAIGPEAFQRLRQRVVTGLKTTFASSYTEEVSLAGALRLDAISVYAKQATGEKYLITPNKGVGSIAE